MYGIVEPADWENIVANNPVFTSEKRFLEADEFLAELLCFARLCVPRGDFCIALSGGLDSSVIAILLHQLQKKFACVTIGRSKQHPDIEHSKPFAIQIQKAHCIKILSGERSSEDVYDDLFSAVREFRFRDVVCCDCVDEMLGGYWQHRKPIGFCEEGADVADLRLKAFNFFWEQLLDKHLRPLDKYAKKHEVRVFLPYLTAHNFLRSVAVELRANNECGKIILRDAARLIGVPDAIINRKKYGLVSVWDE